MAIGEVTLDVSVDGVIANDHEVVVVSDHTIPVEVPVGRTWLVLPHVNYYKGHSELIIESRNVVPNYVVVEHTDSQVNNAYAVDKFPDKEPEPITAEDIVLATQWPADKRDELIGLLNRYRGAFAKNIYELGCTDVLKMDIVVTDGSVPVNVRSYRTSPSDRQWITSILDE